MSSIKPLYPLLALVITLVFAGCGEKNEKALFNAEEGHPSNWAAVHKTSAKADLETCTECHGANLSGGVSQVGCFSTQQTARKGFACHATSPVASSTACISCHSLPPNGTIAPNRAGAHAKHLALAGIVCVTCHSGGGSGTANHAKGTVTVSTLPVSFQAKTITLFGYDAASKKCSGIICHGGLTTPKWDSATAITCLDCHAQGTASQVPQYNSFFSGSNLHALHINVSDSASGCADCHNVASFSATHFSGLTTPVFEATAESTIGGGSTKITNYLSRTCTNSCHASRSWPN